MEGMNRMNQRPAALVTGGSRGIGRAIALELARLGYDLAVNYFDFDFQGKPTAVHADETAGEIRKLGAACETLSGDISRSEDRRRLVDFVRDRFGRCDMLVNNAGVAPGKRMDILDATEESYDRVMNINLRGPYFLTQSIANWMIEQKKAHPQRVYRICSTSSISSFTSSPARGEYCLSKAAVSMMTKLYADRLAEYGIFVFEVQPGIIATDMTAVVKEKYDKLIAEGLTPIRRWGQPDDVAKAVGAIAEGRLDFCTGQVLHVDGGFHLRRL
jgi:3-oxoacyl-[acyl-carrier protein] reductase